MNIETGAYYSVNSPGALVWELLTEKKSLEETEWALARKYALPPKKTATDTRTFIKNLAAAGLVSETSQTPQDIEGILNRLSEKPPRKTKKYQKPGLTAHGSIYESSVLFIMSNASPVQAPVDGAAAGAAARQLPVSKQIKESPVITFLSPDFSTGHLHRHLGANYVVAALRANGVYAEQFINRQPIGLRDLTELILENRPKAVGFTCFNSNHYLVKLFAAELRKKRPDILLIAGGPTATFSDRDVLKDIPEMDLCVRGEGEFTALELAQYIKGAKVLSEIKGITYRKNGDIIRNEDRPLMRQENDPVGALDIFPSPYLTKVLDPEDFLAQGDHIPLLTSRGCVNKCAYCSESVITKHTIRYHSVERIIKELKVLELLKKTGKDFAITIWDDTFTFHRKRTVELLQRIIREGIRLNFWCDTRVDRIDRELLELLYKAGVKQINFGLESGVPRILYAMKKVRLTDTAKNGYAPEKKHLKNIREKVKLAKETGLKVGVSVLFGFPGESLKDGIKTLKFVSELDVDMYSHHHLVVNPGTELFESLKERKPENKKPHFNSFQNSPIPFCYLYSEYDLGLLPRLHVESYRKHKGLLAYGSIMNILMGMPEKTNSKHPEWVILAGDNIPLEWAKNNLAIQTKIVFGKNIMGLTSHESVAKTTVKSLAVLLSAAIADAKSRLASGPGRSIPELPAAPASENSSNGGSGAPGAVISIRDSENAAKLEEQLKSMEPGGNYEAKANPLLGGIILDACRWSPICPALKMQRLIIDTDGNIKPCAEGDILCDTTSPLTKARGEMERISKEIEAKRGCNACSARDRCCKCAFLGSIDVKDYCNIIKNRSAIGKFIKTSKMLNLAAYRR